MREDVEICWKRCYNEIKAMEKTIKAENKPNKIQNKNHLQDNINNDVLKKLEEIRRSK